MYFVFYYVANHMYISSMFRVTNKPLKGWVYLSWRHSMPSMEHSYRWSLAIDGWRIRPLEHKRTQMLVRDRYVAHEDKIKNLFREKSQNNEKSNTELELFELGISCLL